MKYLLALLSFVFVVPLKAWKFNDYFEDKTLRADYIFSGNNKEQSIALSLLSMSEGWHGRRVNLDKLLFDGNAQITMTDSASGKVIFAYSFSTLFQEWQHTEEATMVNKAFENTVLLPMPKHSAYLTLKLRNSHKKTVCEMRHKVSPHDILIRRCTSGPHSDKLKPFMKNGSSVECIDLVYVAEGYTDDEMPQFYADVETAVEAMMSHEPFGKYRKRFNIYTLAIPSQQTDVSQPLQGKWHDTPAMSHFSTFYSDRYLMTERLFALHDALQAVPYEHIIILANTPTYGGGGIYNMYMLTTARNSQFQPVVVHEFGHSFAGLADEYFYDDQYETYYPADTEPWEPNITTLVDFKSKWASMLPHRSNTKPGSPGLYEGGGYQSKGVWRHSFDCRMRTNTCSEFCPVCKAAIEKTICYHTEELK